MSAISFEEYKQKVAHFIYRFYAEKEELAKAVALETDRLAESKETTKQ